MTSSYLVTGGEGFIGSRIVAATNATPFDIKSGRDILNTDLLTKEIEGAQGIFHCAAKISVPESFIASDEYYVHNVKGTASVIRAAAKAKTKVVFSSSAAVYGEVGRAVNEEDSLRPQSPYAENKRDGEALLQVAQIPSVILRYFNVYGPGQSEAYAGVISTFIKKALEGEELVITGDGSQIRDFVYVDDVVAANRVAMNADVPHGEVFNIGSGEEVSIKELAELIIKLTGSSSSISYTEPRKGDIQYSCAEIGKSKKYLDWKPATRLEEGLAQTVASYR